MVHRPGRSRAQLLVAVLIVALAGGLFVAFTAHVRSEADQAKCRNNLKQLYLAVDNFYAATNELPPLVDQGPEAPTGQGLLSVFAALTPFVEATPVMFRPERPPAYYHGHSSLEFTYPGKFGTTVTEAGGMVNQVHRVHIDPADSTADKLRDIPMTLPEGTVGYYATGSYAVNGVLPWGVRDRARWSWAGNENTILIGERPQVCRTAGGVEVYNLWGLGFYSPYMPAFAAQTPAGPPGLWSTGQVAPVEPLPDEAVEDRDGRVQVRIGRRDAPPQPPDFHSPIQVVRGSRPCDPRLAGTPHRSGMQVAMADGSVRVFAQGTSPWVFWRACVPVRERGP